MSPVRIRLPPPAFAEATARQAFTEATARQANVSTQALYLAEALGAKAGLIFENWQLEVERELQLIYEIGGERSPP